MRICRWTLSAFSVLHLKKTVFDYNFAFSHRESCAQKNVKPPCWIAKKTEKAGYQAENRPRHRYRSKSHGKKPRDIENYVKR